MVPRHSRKQIVPGFGVTLSVTLFYVSIMLLLPLAALLARASELSFAQIVPIVTSERVLAACKLSLGAAALAAGVNAILGTVLAWVLTRYDFIGRRWLDALIDLPMALPTAVAGIALSALYGDRGWIGAWTSHFGISIAYTRLGIFVALLYVGLPFLVRTLQPVLAEAERTQEEAALTLGASPWQNFRYVVLPQIMPAILTGAAMAFARGVGEYGSVIFIAGNIPKVSEIAPLLIVTKLEQYDYAAATVIAVFLLSLSLVLLLIMQKLQMQSQRYRLKEVQP